MHVLSYLIFGKVYFNTMFMLHGAVNALCMSLSYQALL